LKTDTSLSKADGFIPQTSMPMFNPEIDVPKFVCNQGRDGFTWQFNFSPIE